MISRLLKQPLFWIFILALVLRIYKLGTFPVGFHADEARVAWNALSILKTGQDDRGNKLALYYNTFGDFRPTGIFYATIPSILAFGRTEFAVRFPAALLGALTVFPLYLFVIQILKRDKGQGTRDKSIALIAALLLAINPWHISTSRATSEVVISLFIALWGFVFFLEGIEQEKIKLFAFSFLLLFLSYFFYHSIRLSAPLFIATIIAFFWHEIKEKNLFKPAFVVFALLSLVTCLLLLDRQARGRFSQVSIFSDLDVKYELSRMPFEEGPNKVFIARAFHNKPSTYTRRFINEYLKYFSSEFFLNSSVPKPARYQTIGVGLLTYIEFALLVLGLIAIAQKRASVLPLFLLLVAPIPAALTTEDAPNLHRALFMIPFLIIIAAYGFQLVIESFRNVRYKFTLLTTLIGLLTLNLIFYLHMYYVHAKVHIPLYRNIGAKELALYLNEVQGNYDKIILTNIPDDPYPWIAFFTGRDPKTFNKDAVAREKGVWTSQNFEFSGQRCPSRDAFTTPEVKRLLVVDAEGCATESNLKDRVDVKIIKRVLRPDESEVYILWSRVVE